MNAIVIICLGESFEEAVGRTKYQTDLKSPSGEEAIYHSMQTHVELLKVKSLEIIMVKCGQGIK